MSFKLKKVLRVISKVVLILVGICLFLYFGFRVFLSVFFDPHDVRLTNVTDSSMTISWITNYPMKSVVYYKDSDSFLPGPLSWIGSGKAYDDRDVSSAQERCVEKYNQDHEVSEDFVVDTSDYDCVDVKVDEYGGYFTHHVTLKNLDSNKMYYFRIGDGFFNWKKDIDSSATFYTLDSEVEMPAPIYGKIVNEEGEYIKDSVVYIKFTNEYIGKESMYYSSVTNENGGWYLDGNNIRTIEGEPMIVESGQDMITVYAQYQNYTLSGENKWIYGNTDQAYPDIVVSDDWEKDLSYMDRGTGIVHKSYAASPWAGVTKKIGTSTESVKESVTTETSASKSISNSSKNGEKNEVAKVEVKGGLGSGSQNNSGDGGKFTFARDKVSTEDNGGSNDDSGGSSGDSGSNNANNQGTKVDNISVEKITETYRISESDWKDLQNPDKAAEVAARVGYGNAAKALARGTNNGVLNKDILTSIGLGGGDVIYAGNLSAIWGSGEGKGITASEVSEANIVLKFDDKESWVKTTSTAPIDNPVKTDTEEGIINVVVSKDSKTNEWKIPDYLKSLNLKTDHCKNNNYVCKLEINVKEIGIINVLNALESAPQSKNVRAIAKKVYNYLVVWKEESFSGKEEIGINLKSKDGKSNIVIYGDLTLGGVDGLDGNLEILVTDELKKLFPLFNDKTKISLNELKERVKAQRDLFDKFFILYTPPGDSEDTSGEQGKTANTVSFKVTDDSKQWDIPDYLKGLGLKTDQCKGKDTCSFEINVEEIELQNVLDALKENPQDYFAKPLAESIYDTLFDSKKKFFTDQKGKGMVVSTTDSKFQISLSNDYTIEGILSKDSGASISDSDFITLNYNLINALDELKGYDSITYGDFKKIVEKKHNIYIGLKNVISTDGENTDDSTLNNIEENQDDWRISISSIDATTFNEKLEEEFATYEKNLSDDGRKLSLRTFIEETVFLIKVDDKTTYIDVNLNGKVDGDIDILHNDNLPISTTIDLAKKEINNKKILNEDDKNKVAYYTAADAETKNIKDAVDYCYDDAYIEKITGFPDIIDANKLSSCIHGDKVKGVSDTTVLGTSTTSNSGYIYYLPEYGIYDLEVSGLTKAERVEGGEDSMNIFYIEMNGISGLQIPEDPENPQTDEDIVLQSDSLEIKYKESAESNTLDIKKGINIISFDYIPVLNTDNSSKASALLEWFAKKDVNVNHMSYFEGGRWNGVGYVSNEVVGSDFTIIPGKGYLLYSEEEKTVKIPGYDITQSIPVPLYSGWNLIGVHGYTKAYTAESLLESINSIEGITADNVSWWPTSEGKYEGLQVTDGQVYGLDFAISKLNGYFVRISKFEPKDETCGSIIWHPSGKLNGKCGNSKTVN